MNILITGYNGFIGSNLTLSLKKYRLFGIDIVKGESVLFHFSWDNFRNCKNVDAIIHLAGKAHDTKNSSSEKEYHDVNVGLTKKIFDFYLKSNATKFIFFSSVKAVADTVKGTSLTEDEIPHPQTPYGKSKLEAEQYILNELEKWNHTEQNRGVASSETIGQKKVYILRPCMIHGPGNKGNLNVLYQLVSKGVPWPLGAFENLRSFTSIDNLAWILGQIIEKDVPGGIYQMADDEPVSTNRLIELIAESKGEKARIWNSNKALIHRLAGVGDFLHLPLNRERLKKLTESYVVSNEKLKHALTIKKMPVSAEEGLIKTLQSFNINN